MNNIIDVTNFFIRGVKPAYLSKPITSLMVGMTLLDKMVEKKDVLTIESIPTVCKVMFEDDKVNWGRILTIIWIGVHLKGKYPDQTDIIYNAIVVELLKHKTWIMNQRSYMEKLYDYVKGFYHTDENDYQYFVLT